MGSESLVLLSLQLRGAEDPSKPTPDVRASEDARCMNTNGNNVAAAKKHRRSSTSALTVVSQHHTQNVGQRSRTTPAGAARTTPRATGENEATSRATKSNAKWYAQLTPVAKAARVNAVKEYRRKTAEDRVSAKKEEAEVQRSRRDAEKELANQRQALRFERRIEEGWDTVSAKLYANLEEQAFRNNLPTGAAISDEDEQAEAKAREEVDAFCRLDWEERA